MSELPPTERRAENTVALDCLSARQLAERFAAADLEAARAVQAASAEIATAIELAAAALGAGGRVIFLGAGTSGRLAVMEAAECIPTFSCERIVGLMAGGSAAFVRAKEGAEDDRAAGRAELGALAPGQADFVCGISASGGAPWVAGALEAAHEAGASTGLITCVGAPAGLALNVVVVLPTGSEVLAGSTRMKAGTATKCALNAITTGAMSLGGQVYDDLMVDVSVTNAKLVKRARRIVTTLVPEGDAEALLEAAGGQVKTAVAMGRLGISAEAARERLAAAGGHLRRALEGSA